MAGAMTAISTVNAASGRGGVDMGFDFMSALTLFLFAILIYAVTRILVSAVKEGEVFKSVISALLVVLLIAVTFRVPAILEEEPSDELIDQWIGWAPILSANGRTEIVFADSDGVIEYVDAWVEKNQENNPD